MSLAAAKIRLLEDECNTLRSKVQRLTAERDALRAVALQLLRATAPPDNPERIEQAHAAVRAVLAATPESDGDKIK